MAINFKCLQESCIYLEVFIDAKENYKYVQCQKNHTWKCNENDCPILRGEEDGKESQMQNMPNSN